jgi:penicillin-binding protein 2
MAKHEAGKMVKEGMTRRGLLLGGLATVTVGALVSRLYYLQFMKADQYKVLAEGNRVKLQILPPPRGLMLDRNGVTIAGRRQNFRLLLEPEQARKVHEVLERLQKIVPLSENKLKEVRRQLRGRSGPTQLLKEYLTWDEVAAIEFHTPDLPGIVVDVGEMRDYPLSDKAAHLLGYVGAVSQADNPDTPLLKQPGFRIGKGGLEKSLEKTLQGEAGARYIEADVYGQTVRELKRQPAEPGHDITLGLHAELQQFTADRMGEESGAVIVLDAHTGQVLTLVSNPGFDPNRFSGGITTSYWKELMENPRKPLLNKATHGVYPPGSTFKMITGIAGLQSGLISPHTSFFCPGHWYLGNHRFNCWKETGHGSVNCERAIAVSCDTYFYSVAQRIGIDRIVSVAEQFGFGHITSELLPGEKSALLPSPEWKRRQYRAPWTGGDTINVSIGQGYMLSTPMQLAVMTARLVNGGKKVSPRFVLSEEVAGDAKEIGKVDVSPEILQVIRRGMDAVTNHVGGTAYGSRIPDVGMEMGGKTGTAQVRRILQRGQNQNKLPWHLRHHAWFVGYAPVDNPRFVCSVLVEHGGGGSSAAAPVARDVLKKAQELMGARNGEMTIGEMPADMLKEDE